MLRLIYHAALFKLIIAKYQDFTYSVSLNHFHNVILVTCEYKYYTLLPVLTCLNDITKITLIVSNGLEIYRFEHMYK